MSETRPFLANQVQFHLEDEDGPLRDPIELLDRSADLEFDGIELRDATWTESEETRDDVRAYVDSNDVLLVYATGTELLIPNRGDGQEQLWADIDTAADIGAPYLRVFTGDVPDESHQSWDKAAEAVEYARQRDVTLLLENHGLEPGTTISELTDVLTAIDDPTLRVNVDVGNFYANEIAVQEAIETLADDIRYVHFRDPSAPDDVVGTGEMPMTEIATMLNELDQEVWYGFEFLGGDDPETALVESRRFVESTF
jgi:sugar phosphate isomerase/epimerase